MVDSPWVLLTSSGLPDKELNPTTFPVETFSTNDFVGMSFNEIASFMHSNDSKLKDLDVERSVWIVIDQKGIENDTCIVFDRTMAEETTSEVGKPFKAGRLPYTHAWSMMANLPGNMIFGEWMDEDAGIQMDGSYKWVGPFGMNEAQAEGERETEARRKGTMKEMRKLGHVD